MKYFFVFILVFVFAFLLVKTDTFKNYIPKEISEKTYNEWKEASISYTLDNDSIVSYHSDYNVWIKYPKWTFSIKGSEIINAIDSNGVDQLVGNSIEYRVNEHRIKDETFNRILHVKDSLLEVIKNTPIPPKWER